MNKDWEEFQYKPPRRFRSPLGKDEDLIPQYIDGKPNPEWDNAPYEERIIYVSTGKICNKYIDTKETN